MLLKIQWKYFCWMGLLDLHLMKLLFFVPFALIGSELLLSRVSPQKYSLCLACHIRLNVSFCKDRAWYMGTEDDLGVIIPWESSILEIPEKSVLWTNATETFYFLKKLVLFFNDFPSPILLILAVGKLSTC